MATTKKRTVKKPKARVSGPIESRPKQTQVIEQLKRERDEALEQLAAASHILRVIASSPMDLQPVLDAIVESAARVCGIDDVLLRLVENEFMIPRAHFGPMPTRRVEIRIDDEPQFRWIRDHGTLHVPDVRAQSDFPSLGSGSGFLTFLGAPLRDPLTEVEYLAEP